MSRRGILIVSATLAGSCVGEMAGPEGSSGEPGSADVPGGTAPGSKPGTGASAPGSGTGAGTPVTPAAAQACKVRDPGPSPLRRLTSWEYDNTVRDLLGDSTRPATASFPSDNRIGAFDNNAVSQVVSGLLAQDYADTAERLVAAAWPNLAMQLPCNAATGDAACGAKFIDSWGKRAWRRPLDAQEKAAFNGLLTTLLPSSGFTGAMQRVVQAMLQSPQFLYRIEVGEPVAGSTMVKLTSYEIASRLSYMLWGSMPDDALMAAADAGKLGTREEIAAQARRMLDSADGRKRARDMVNLFHREWLQLDGLDQVEKDAKLFPTFRATKPLLQKETDAFVESVVWDPAGTMGKLLTSPFTMMNAKLADFYGVTGARPAGDTFERVSWDASQRGGLLTMGAFMATHAKPDQTYPPGRGKFVRENMLCQQLPPPVANVMPPQLDPKLTGRQRWEAHSQQPCAAACHLLMEPIGLGLENLDAVGKWRTTENGKPVDASGELTASDVDGKFVGPVELAARLASSAAVSDCMVTQWFQFAYGRSEAPGDECNRETLKGTFKASGGNVRELLVALTQTDAFMFRRGGTP